MIGLDTNVLLQILTSDDELQLRTVRKLLASRNDAVGEFFVNQVVLAECVWALKSAYGLDRNDIARGLEGLLETPAFAIEEPKVVAVALKHYKESVVDFSDCLIAAKNADNGCTHTATFDKKMRGLPAVKVL